MAGKRENSVAQAGADRADVTVLAGNDDVGIGSRTARERQAGYLRKVYAVSLPLARVIAEHAFDPGRRRA